MLARRQNAFQAKGLNYNSKEHHIMAGAKKAVDFEAAQQKLEEILQRLSEDDVSLDESVTLYATASELIAQCSAALKNAELKVQEIDASLAQALGQQAQEGAADDV
jgi:exodeoxyribonuclease VII small subunit